VSRHRLRDRTVPLNLFRFHSEKSNGEWSINAGLRGASRPLPAIFRAGSRNRNRQGPLPKSNTTTFGVIVFGVQSFSVDLLASRPSAPTKTQHAPLHCHLPPPSIAWLPAVTHQSQSLCPPEAHAQCGVTLTPLAAAAWRDKSSLRRLHIPCERRMISLIGSRSSRASNSAIRRSSGSTRSKGKSFRPSRGTCPRKTPDFSILMMYPAARPGRPKCVPYASRWQMATGALFVSAPQTGARRIRSRTSVIFARAVGTTAGSLWTMWQTQCAPPKTGADAGQLFSAPINCRRASKGMAERGKTRRRGEGETRR